MEEKSSKKPREKKKKLIVGAIIIAFFLAFAYWENNVLTVSEYEYSCPKVPDGFEGFCIVQLSDYHNKSNGANRRALVKRVAGLEPDIIVITGDLIDQKHRGYDHASELVKAVVEIAPVYYVTGNHERHTDEYEKIKAVMLDCGVRVLENETARIERNGEAINIIGLDGMPERADMLESLMAQTSSGELNILLSHYPEDFEYYAECAADVVFAGHAHGGQFRFPFTDGLYAPGQGLFPKLASGVHTSGETTMYISRGLGNSGFPLRLFNRPEIVAVTLRKQK